MKNKLYFILIANSDSDERISLMVCFKIILSYLRSEPYSLECLRLIILKSDKIIYDRPIYEELMEENLLLNNNFDFAKSLQKIIDHIKSEPKDRIYPTIICFNLSKSEDDFTKELNELNKISQGVFLITNNKFYNYYNQFGLLDRENIFSTGFAKLILIEKLDLYCIKDIFKYMYVDLEVEEGIDSIEIPPTPLEVTQSNYDINTTNFHQISGNFYESKLREHVHKIFKELNISYMIIICSKTCKESPKDIEWLIIPEQKNQIFDIDRQKIIDQIKTNYDNRFFIAKYYYLLKIDINNRFIFEYGRYDLPDLSEIQNKIQPALILNNSKYLSKFICSIFEGIEKYPPNSISCE